MQLEALLASGRRVRTLGVDDAPFERDSDDPVLVVGAVCEDARFEGLISTRVTPDGFDATERLVQTISRSKFLPQLHAVLINGVTLAGFNVVDLPGLREALQLPVVAVMRRRPDHDAMAAVVERLPQRARRAALLRCAGRIHDAGDIFLQVHGVEPPVAVQLMGRLTRRGHVPEPLRIAHLIGAGVVLGESGRRA